jgi:putative methyltransferase (TIGR04325 family)
LHAAGVLQYLEQPHVWLEEVIDAGFQTILLDRTALTDGQHDRLTIQRVGSSIYPASYPAWFFARARLLEAFRGSYELVEEFDAIDRANLSGTRYKGFLFERVRK